jgi:hypothetical protein
MAKSKKAPKRVFLAYVPDLDLPKHMLFTSRSDAKAFAAEYNDEEGVTVQEYTLVVKEGK